MIIPIFTRQPAELSAKHVTFQPDSYLILIVVMYALETKEKKPMITFLFIGAAGLMFITAALLAGSTFARPVRQPVRVRRDQDRR